jgi:hypothetical protein
VYSIALLLGIVVSLAQPAVRGAVVHDAPQGAGVVAGVLRRAPYTGNAELAAPAFLIVVWAVNPPPGMAAADFDAPTLPFGVPECFLDLFLRMRGTSHQWSPVWGSLDWLSSDNQSSKRLTRVSGSPVIKKFGFPGFRSLKVILSSEKQT